MRALPGCQAQREHSGIPRAIQDVFYREKTGRMLGTSAPWQQECGDKGLKGRRALASGGNGDPALSQEPVPGQGGLPLRAQRLHLRGLGGGEGPWGRGQMQNVVPDGRRSGVGRVDRDGHPRHMAQLCVRSRGQAAAQGPFTRAHFLEFCFTNELANVLHFVRRATDISQCNVQ